MKQLILAAGLVLSTQAAFAQANGQCLQVNLVNAMNTRQVIQVYPSRLNDDCYEARKQCRMDSVGRTDLQCVKVYATTVPAPIPNPPPRPNPYPTPVPTPVPAPMPQSSLPYPRLGDVVVVEGHNFNSIVERRTLQGDFEVRNQSTQTLFILPMMELGVTQGCTIHPLGDICVGDQVIARGHNFNSTTEALFRNGRVAYRNSSTQQRFFSTIPELALTKGCVTAAPRVRVCVGDSVRAEGHNYLSIVEGLFENRDVVIRNSSTGTRFTYPVNQLH